jgi:WD40 repeat protein
MTSLNAIMKLRRNLAVLLVIVLLAVWQGSGLLTQPITDQTALAQPLVDLAWSADGVYLAAITAESLTIFDENLQQVAFAETIANNISSDLMSVAWHPDGDMLATGGGWDDGTIHLWDFDPVVMSLQVGQTLNTGYEAVQHLSFSPGATYLGVIGLNSRGTFDGYPGHVELWNTSTWIQPDEAYFLFAPYRLLSWDESASSIVVAGYNGIAQLAVPSLDSLWYSNLVGLTEDVDASAENMIAHISPSYVMFIEAGASTSTSSLLPPLVPHSLAWSRNGAQIAVEDGRNVTLYDAATLTELASLPVMDEVIDLEFSQTRLAIGYASGTLLSWDVEMLPDVSGTATVTPFPTIPPTRTPTPTPGL